MRDRIGRKTGSSGPLAPAPVTAVEPGIVGALSEAPQARRPLVTWPRWAAGPAPVYGSLRLVIVAGLLLALTAGTILLSSRLLETTPLPPRRNVPMVSTGIDILTAETASYARVVVDGEGMLWAREEGGRLVRYDPATGSGRSWTVSDDPAFGMTDIAPARAGGVWLVDGHTLRWFDGALFREVIDATTEIALAVEAPDATLWAATTNGAVLHWDGSSWTTLEPGRPNPDAAINALAVDAAGRAWVGWLQYPTPPGTGWVSRYDGSSWTTFDAKDADPLGGGVWMIAQLPDGAVWVATSAGLARFDGSSWTDETAQPYGGRTTASVAAGPDGSIWVAEGDHDRGSITVRQFVGRSRVSYGASDGLPADAGFYTAWVVPTAEGTYVGTGDGIFRLSNGRWTRAWPRASSPVNLNVLLAISRDELWAAGGDGLWHFLHGRWTNESIDPSSPSYAPDVLSLAPDGTLWAAGTGGVAYRRDGHWTVADDGAASAIVVDGSGTVWVAGNGTWLASGPELWTLRFDGTSWARQTITGCPLPSLGNPIGSLAIDATGALWVGIRRGYEPGGLARYDGRTWEAINQVGGSEISGAAVLGMARGGDVWIAATYPIVPSRAQAAQAVADEIRAARFDGNGWSTVEMPDDFWVGPSLAPDGSLWAATRRGPARYDGQRWTYPYAAVALSPWMGGDVTAPDGTVFGWIGSSLLRFPGQAPAP